MIRVDVTPFEKMPALQTIFVVCDDCGTEERDRFGYSNGSGVCTTLPAGWRYRMNGSIRGHVCVACVPSAKAEGRP